MLECKNNKSALLMCKTWQKCAI